MSFAAEPYGTFVEDLLANLTGGVSRLPFRYVEEELPFRLEEPRVRVASVRAHGLVDQEFTEFVRGRDFRTTSEGHVEWAAPGQEFNPPGAVLPDPGTVVWVGFDKLPGDTRPLLNDRNPGSVLRTLAESFAREFAVLSQQLDLVYDAAFVETATGRDLDQVAALVGVSRRGATHARGEVVLRRPTPAPADITVPAGTLVSTARPPQITVETTEAVTLRRGSFSVAAPVRAQQPGPDGVAAERTLTVIHRAIFGIEEVLNPAGLAFRGGAEPDDELRSRVSRALESSGRSTVGAIRGALASLEGIREQDVLVQEDHLTSPGLVRVKVAAAITEETAILASRLLEDHRPAGIRIEHNLPAPTTPIPTTSQDTGGGGDGPPDTPAPALDDVFAPLLARVVVTPADVQLNETQKTRLAEVVEAALVGAIDEIGAGEPVVYNRLVSAVMAVHGVLDAVLEIGVPTTPEQKPLRRYNLRPEQGRRPQLAPGDLSVEIRGDRVVLDVTATVERGVLTAGLETTAALTAIKEDIEQRLVQFFLVAPVKLDPSVLMGALPSNDQYTVEQVRYDIELMDEGLLVHRKDVELTLDSGQIVWVRSVRVSGQETMT